MKKLLALMLVAALVVCMAACGAKDTEEPVETTIPVETETLIETEEIEIPETDETAAAAEETDAAAEAEEATEAAADEAEAEEPEETTEAEEENKTPETVEEIVEFYKKAATETNKGKINATEKMSLVELNGGSGLVGGMLDLFEPIAKSALERNSGTMDHITGGFKNLTADDVASATAKNDGKYTTVRINLKEQTDGFSSDSQSGHVGHGVSVLGDVQKAIDELKGVSVDASDGTIKLHYNNAYIDAKIDNETGKVVSGTWHHTVNATIDNVKAKIAVLSATLKGASGVVDYTITL